MPLQKIETVYEPASRSQVQDKLFNPVKAHQDDFRNRLIWGDNKLMMASLLKEFKGKIDLVYIDPLFLEMAVLEAEPVCRSKNGKRKVDIKLTKFLPSLAEVHSKKLDIKSGFDFIDCRTVDFDWHKAKPFEHNWQDFRTCKDRTLKTVSDFGYDRYPKKANILPVSRQLMFSDGSS